MTEALDRELRRRRQLVALDALLAANPPSTVQLESARRRIRAVVDWTEDELTEALPDSLAGKPTKQRRP